MLSVLLFVAQTSVLVSPLHVSAAPPPTRAVAALRIADAPDQPGSGLREAERVLRSLPSPAEFAALARSTAQRSQAGRSGAFGIYPPGMLAREIQDALSTLAVGERSAPIAVPGGAFVVERIEDSVGCRQVYVAGKDAAARERAELVARLVRGGVDFDEVARERSDDRASALRGGDLAIYERGVLDSGLREAAFNARMGEIVGPIETPLGFHVLQRVGVDAIDLRLRDDNWAHARAILVAFAGARGADPTLARDHDAAEQLAADLAARIRRGEDMAALASEFSDDVGRREAGGDLGWLRRKATVAPPFFDRLFVEPPGVLIGPIASTAGYVLLRREDPGLRSRIDVRIDPFADLEQWVRALARGSSPLPDIDGLGAAVEAARALDAAFERGSGWAHIETYLPLCARAADLSARCASLAERADDGRGGAAALRELAVGFARALEALEPKFFELVWPEHERALQAAAAELRLEMGTLADCALEQVLLGLALPDPRVVAPVYLVAAGPQADGVSHATSIGSASWLDVAAADAQRLDRVLYLTAIALDASSKPISAREQLGAAFERARVRADSPKIDAAHRALLEVASAWAARRVFDGPGSRVESSSAVVDAVRTPWEAFLAGKQTREAALDRIVAALSN